MNSPLPKVTIGIPCRNAGQWIRVCLESALKQTWLNKEIIVVENGSTDDTAAILRTFGNQIRVLTTPPLGANHARNEILENATGEWIQYLDADDYMLPEKIERQFAEGSMDVDILYSPTFVEETNSEGTTRTLGALDPQLDLYSQWITWQLPQTGGALWKRESLQKIGGWNEEMPCCQEHELYMRAIQHGLRFLFCPTPNAVYRIWSEETLCRRNPTEVIHVKTKLIDEFMAWLISNNRWEFAHQLHAGQACFEMSRTYAKHNLSEATQYHENRKQADLNHLAGPAAPLSYKLCYFFFGFANAERIASKLR